MLQLLPVPLVRQAYPHSCGAAAFLSILYYYCCHQGPESSLHEALAMTESDGVHPERLVMTALSYGLTAEFRQGVTCAEVRLALQRSEPVILDIQAWIQDPVNAHWSEIWSEGHYVVVVGMDDQHIYVMDPAVAAAYAYIPLDEFVARWHDEAVIAGERVRYNQPAIFLVGEKPAQAYPQALERVH